jgi:hypothetical protein
MLPPVPSGYPSWNAYIEEQGAIIAAAQGLTFQEGKASVKLLDVASPGRTDPASPDYMIYNLFTTWASRAVAPTEGRPWLLGTPPPPPVGSFITTESGDVLTTESGDSLITT